MVASHHSTRICTLELKELIYERIGQERAEQYFNHLNRYLNLKLSKAEFGKSCIQAIGKENLSLHNRLIGAILQNVGHAKTPARKIEALSVKAPISRNNLHSVYGDAFPRKSRSPRDRKIQNRPSPLGPFGKSPSIVSCEEPNSPTQEQESLAELQTPSIRPPMGNASACKEFEKSAKIPNPHRWSSISAPIDISIDLCGAHKAAHSSLHRDFAETCQSSGELPDTKSLGRRLLKELALKGVGISLDGANLLNKGLDVYMKKVIKQSTFASMIDFRAAIESNPSLLGENGPRQLEKICSYGS